MSGLHPTKDNRVGHEGMGQGYYKYACFYFEECQNWVWVNQVACASCLANGKQGPKDELRNTEEPEHVERHQQSLNQLNFATQQPLSGTYNLSQLEEEDKKVTQIMDATRDILDTMPGASIIILPHQRASDQVFGAAQSLSYSASSRYVESSSQGKPPVTINETATFPTTIKCANLRTAISNMPKSTPSTKATQNATQTSPSSRDNKGLDRDKGKGKNDY